MREIPFYSGTRIAPKEVIRYFLCYISSDLSNPYNVSPKQSRYFVGVNNNGSFINSNLRNFFQNPNIAQKGT